MYTVAEIGIDGVAHDMPMELSNTRAMTEAVRALCDSNQLHASPVEGLHDTHL